MLFEAQAKIALTPSIKRNLDPKTQTSRAAVATKKSSKQSTTISPIKASSNFTPQCIWDPEELKQAVEPIIKRRKVLDLTVPDEFEGSNKLNSSLTSAVLGKPIMVPKFKQEREPTIEETGETLEPGCLQDTHSTLSAGCKKESHSEPMPIDEGKIFIENYTTFVLHVTIHGEKETWSVVGPKQGDECSRKSFTIQGNSAYVTIKNNAHRELCCGWEEKLLINRGGTHLVQGEPYLRIKDDCPHV
jgi:hypothetical protein